MGRKCLAKPPGGRNNIEKFSGFSIDQSDLKRQDLASNVKAALPVCPPIPMHGNPCSCRGAPYPYSLRVTTTTDVRDHHHIKIRLPLQSETDSSSPFAWHPSTHKHNNNIIIPIFSFIYTYIHKDRARSSYGQGSRVKKIC